MKAYLALASLVFVSACHDRLEDPKVERAWVRLPAVSGQPAVAYFNIVGGGSDASRDKLIRVESALAEHAEMHESMRGASGMAGMRALTEVAIPPYSLTTFEPGGRHVMLFGLEKVVVPGTAVPLRFGFASGRTAEAEAKTVRAGDDAPY